MFETMFANIPMIMAGLYTCLLSYIATAFNENGNPLIYWVMITHVFHSFTKKEQKGVEQKKKEDRIRFLFITSFHA